MSCRHASSQALATGFQMLVCVFIYLLIFVDSGRERMDSFFFLGGDVGGKG